MDVCLEFCSSTGPAGCAPGRAISCSDSIEQATFRPSRSSAPESAERLGIPAIAAGGIGLVAGLIRRCIRWRPGGECSAVRRMGHQTAVVPLPRPGYRFRAGGGLSVGGGASLPLPRHDTVLRIASGRMLRYFGSRRGGPALHASRTASRASRPNTDGESATHDTSLEPDGARRRARSMLGCRCGDLSYCGTHRRAAWSRSRDHRCCGKRSPWHVFGQFPAEVFAHRRRLFPTVGDHVGSDLA